MAAGQPKTFKTPDQLLALWDAYKASIDSKKEKQEIATAKGPVTITVDKPYTRQGFEAFVYRKEKKHIHQYLDNDGNNYDEFLGIVTHIRNEWQDNQISGTLTGKYKSPNLVARLNGITDKKEITMKEQPLFPDEK